MAPQGTPKRTPSKSNVTASAKKSATSTRSHTPPPKAAGTSPSPHAASAASTVPLESPPPKKKDIPPPWRSGYLIFVIVLTTMFGMFLWNLGILEVRPNHTGTGYAIGLCDRMDLLAFRHIPDVWKAEREFLLFDFCALVLSMICLIHAWQCAKCFALYLSIFFGGALIDLTIRKIPQLASFWQGQNWMEMLDYSEPAYILFGMYFVFQYPAVQMAQNLNFKSWLPEAAAAALLATLIYHPYDIVGAKYVWWLWHRDDPLMVPSEVGVPVASTFWTMAYTGALAATLRLTSESKYMKGWSPVQVALVAAPVASLGLMNVPFCLYYQPLVLGCKISERMVVDIFRAICLAGTIYGLYTRRPAGADAPQGRLRSLLLLLVPMVCLGALAAIVTQYDPAGVQRYGLFQTYGPCDVRESAYFGWKERAQYNCKEMGNRNAVLWNFDCVDKLPENGAQWYTVCPTTFPEGWKKVFATHSIVGAAGVLVLHFMAHAQHLKTP